jgi:hypothetical protein
VVLVWDATQGGSPKQSMHAQHADNSAMANWSLQNLQRRTGDQLSIAIAAQRWDRVWGRAHSGPLLRRSSRKALSRTANVPMLSCNIAPAYLAT